FCDRQLEHLASCERLWRSWVDRAFAVFLRVCGDERLVARRLGLREPVAAAEDAVDVLRADLARKLGGIVRPVGEEEELRAEPELDHRLYLGVRVVVLRTADDEIRLHRRILGDDRRQVGRLRRVDRLVYSPNYLLVQQRLDAVVDRGRERTVQ